MAVIRLEKMTYTFDVVTDWHTNSYILNEMQKKLDELISEKRGSGATILDTTWNLRRHDVTVDA